MKMTKQLLNFCAAAMVLATGTASAQYVAPISTLAVPMRMGGNMIMDGDDYDHEGYSDWQTTMIGKEAGAGVTPHAGDGFDFNFRFKLCWDFTYLYLIADIIDDIEEDYVIGKSQPWTWDNVEVFIDLDTNSTTEAYSTTSTTQMRFCRGLLDANGEDSLVESNSRGAGGPGTDSVAATAQRKLFKFFEDAHATVENGTGWHFEVAIPWTAATDSASVDIHDRIALCGGTVIGFDIAAADADGDGTGDTGGRNVAGGAQAFWDLDDPQGTGNEDNAYQNRLVFGFIQLTGVPIGMSCDDTANSSVTSTSEEKFIKVFPNPASDRVTFSNLSGFQAATVTNLVGQTVRTVEITNDKIKVEINDLPAGIYFFKPDNAAYAVKFVKQ